MELLADKGAVFSPCRRYRYLLWRRWDRENLDFCNFIMLNPSTATELENDPTVWRCIIRAHQLGYGGLYVTNIFSWRATDPKDMRAAADPIGPDNDTIILETAKVSELVVCAWGNHGDYLGRGAAVRSMLADIPVCALKVSKTGQPCHPLYQPYSLKPAEWHV